MAPGHWVFPTAVLGFLVFFASFLYTTPATPAPESRLEQFIIAQPGDTVWVEYTQYYNLDQRFVSFTTLEDEYHAGELNLSPYGAGLDGRPTPLGLPNEPTQDAIIQSILGRHVNETFETEPVENLYGAWTETRDLSPRVATLPLRVDLQHGQSLGQSNFNLTQFVQTWSQFQGEPLEVGDEIPCESGRPWQCRVTAYDAGAGTLSFERTADAGQTIPARAIIQFAPGTPTPESLLMVQTAGSSQIDLVWQLSTGDAFVVARSMGDWEAGAYHIDAVGPQEAQARYAPPSGQQVSPPAHLIGQPVWFEMTIVQIDKPDASTPNEDA